MNLGLLYVCAIAGLIIVVGSVFLLIWKSRIMIDAQGGAVSEIELPFGFKLRTQLPVVAMCFVGAFLLTLPIILIRNTFEEVPIVQLTGKIHRAGSYKAYAIASDCDASNEVRLVVPYVKNANYTVRYYDSTRFVFDEIIDLSKAVNGKYELKAFEPPSPTSPQSTPAPTPAVQSTESISTVSTFK